MSTASRQEIARLAVEAVRVLDQLQDAVTTEIAEEGDMDTLGSVAKDFENTRAFVVFWAETHGRPVA